MIYQKDWLIRQIERMIAAISHVMLNTETPIEDTVTTEQQLRAKMISGIQNGRICETENWLYENMDDDGMWLHLAVFFYSELNRCSDEYLEAHDFPRDEIASGLMDVCREYGYDWVESLARQ